MTGHHIDNNGYMSLINVMYDKRQFAVDVSVPDKSFATLQSYSMQQILLKFGMCHLVALDDGTPIKGAFIAMCEALQLNHDIVAKGNHKDLTVEYFHRFLIKSVTTATEERGTNDMFVPTGIAASYAWNSVLISATDILCSIPAIYR